MRGAPKINFPPDRDRRNWRESAVAGEFGAENRSSRRRIVVLLCLMVAVGILISAIHWPGLSARALSLDDGQFLKENALVQNPSWASAKRFLVEVFEPSTVGGYYLPLSMISLMFDYQPVVKVGCSR